MPSSNNKSHIDFTRFVSVGDSITSGYSDGALHYDGQQTSYANLIAGQFKLNGAQFKQALINQDSVGIGFSGNARMILKQATDCSGKTAMILSHLAPVGDLNIFSTNHYKTQGPFHNLGIPGAKAVTLLAPGYGNSHHGAGNYNPFFTRIASNPIAASILSDAMLIDPTFFSLFIGNNDVLTYALSGGTMDMITPVAGPPGIGFENSLIAIIDALTAKGAKGVIANIPHITSIPCFTAIPYDGLMLDKAKADLLNNTYKHLSISFYEGNNPFLMEDSSGVRQIQKGELILLDLQLDPNKCHYMKAINPIPKKYVLTASEVFKIQDAITSYNTIIQSLAQSKGLAFVDTNAILKSVKANIVFNKMSLNIKYKPKGVFSLDGLHINTLGQVLLADEFIKAINNKYRTAIPRISFAKYRKALSYPYLKSNINHI